MRIRPCKTLRFLFPPLAVFHLTCVGIVTISVPGFFPLLSAKSRDVDRASSRASRSLEVRASSPVRHTSTGLGFTGAGVCPAQHNQTQAEAAHAKSSTMHRVIICI